VPESKEKPDSGSVRFFDSARKALSRLQSPSC